MNFYIFKYYKTIKIITIIMLITFFMLLLINQNKVLCENNASTEDKDLILLSKEIFCYELYKHVRQEDFEALYNSRFYTDIILQENFIKTFIAQLDLEKMIILHNDKDTTYIKQEVMNQFHDYIRQKQLLYQKEFLRNTFSHMVGNLSELLEKHIRAHSSDIEVDGFIKTPGFLAHMEIENYNKIQNFIKKGIVLKIDFDTNKIVFTISCYGICFIKKEFSLC